MLLRPSSVEVRENVANIDIEAVFGAVEGLGIGIDAVLTSRSLTRHHTSRLDKRC